MSPNISRRTLAQIIAAAGVGYLVGPARADDRPTEADVSREAILFDPATPTAGNPKGDLTIVVFFDYNCPYCKQSEPELTRLVKTDGKIRLVYKDWPILTPDSIKGAQWALAAKYQGRYDDAHLAMMAIPGTKIPAARMREAIAKSGVDMDRLDADLQTSGDDITKLLRRNLAQADSLGLQGTPAYIVGDYRVTQALNYEGFKRVAADARARAAKK
ncbi:protein-disulfide isomerase [Bradyrhizobium betae]|uniref:DsbA family protein n=1 Tax=Bradyrhizobium betae TaxID=244734 RepID=A0A5P6NZ61_9BRAD|nr:DsbA family protein [Bradyrhizobium betae]MCS3725318.1 protein-disulfide isomerase [Bradyrhizobium betae]QFI71361.1 DsbA family protein [Bradyrhizobium betae]